MFPERCPDVAEIRILIFTGCLIPININNENTTTEQDNSTQETYNKEFYENILVSIDIQDIFDGK